MNYLLFAILSTLLTISHSFAGEKIFKSGKIEDVREEARRVSLSKRSCVVINLAEGEAYGKELICDGHILRQISGPEDDGYSASEISSRIKGRQYERWVMSPPVFYRVLITAPKVSDWRTEWRQHPGVNQ